MVKEKVVYIYNGILLSRKKEFEILLFVPTWMYLEDIMLNKINKTEKDKKKKSRDITLPTNVCLVKAMVFPVVMYGYENWTIKKAER